MKFRYIRHNRSEHQPPCITFDSRWLWADLDWTPWFPYGGCLGIRVGPKRPWPPSEPTLGVAKRGFTLDVNAYHGDPNRLYLWGARREYMIGLIEWHRFKETRPRTTKVNQFTGNPIDCLHGEHVRCRPKLVRGQAWDWKLSEGTEPPRWRWLVIHPNDWRERWARAHPVEAAEAEKS